MTISKFRGWLYFIAKILGDAQAAQKASRTHSGKPILKRIERRVLGRIAGKILGGLTR